MKAPESKWPYLFLTVVLLVLTRALLPDVAEWMVDSIERTVRYVMDTIPTIQG